jgi:hypothetical protein
VKVRFLTLAQQELDDTVAWYNEQAAGLGQEFLDELDRVVRRAVTFPMPCHEIVTRKGHFSFQEAGLIR